MDKKSRLMCRAAGSWAVGRGLSRQGLQCALTAHAKNRGALSERESHALGTRAGNWLYVRVSNCSRIERIRPCDAHVARIKGEKVRRECHHHGEMEAEPGGAPWDGRQEVRPFLGRVTHVHPSFPQVTSGV